MKKLLLMIVISLFIPSILGYQYYEDDYTDGIFNWTDTNSAGWYENTTDGYLSSTNLAIYGQMIKTFPQHDFNSNMGIDIDVYAQPGDYSFFTILALTDGDDWATMTNYVVFDLDEDINADGFDDMRIYCGGSCSCEDTYYNGTSRDDPYYTFIITSNNGVVTLERNDSNTITSNVTGCDLSDFRNVSIYSMHEPQAKIFHFGIEADDVTEPIVIIDPVYSNVVLNETYADGGIYSNLYNTDLQGYSDGYMWDVDGGSPDKGYLDLNDISETNNPYINWNLSDDWNMTIIGKRNTTDASAAQIILEVGGSLPYTDAFDLDILFDYNVDSDIWMRSYCYPNQSFCTSGLTYTDILFSSPTDTDEHLIKAVYDGDTDNLDVYYDGTLNISMPLTFNNDASIFMVAVGGVAGVRSIVVEQFHEEICTPNWTCSNYGLCEMDDFQYCNETTDNNMCGESYTGNFSEFTPLACDYCTPNWTCSGYAACLINDTQYCNAVTDQNTCGDTYGGDYSEFEPQACTYTPSGYVIQYEAGDIAPIVLDGLGKFGVVIVSLITLVALVFLYGWLKGKIF